MLLAAAVTHQRIIAISASTVRHLNTTPVDIPTRLRCTDVTEIYLSAAAVTEVYVTVRAEVDLKTRRGDAQVSLTSDDELLCFYRGEFNEEKCN